VKTYIVKTKLTQFYEQRIEADDPSDAANKAAIVAGTGTVEPISVEFISNTQPVELAYEG
jgi:hypothetical protein